MASWRSYVMFTNSIPTQMQFTFSAEGIAANSKHCILTRMGLYFCKKGLMEAAGSSGPGMLRKPGSWHVRNSAGLWKAFLSISQKRSKAVGKRRIFNVLCKTENLKILYFQFRKGKLTVIHSQTFFVQVSCGWCLDGQVSCQKGCGYLSKEDEKSVCSLILLGEISTYGIPSDWRYQHFRQFAFWLKFSYN